LGLGVAGLPTTPELASAKSVSHASASDAAAFWTTGRMRRARPLDVHLDGSAAMAEAGPMAQAGPSRLVPPLAPATASDSSAPETVADPTTAMSRTNGAIFIELPFGLARCSGTAVNAPNFSVVFTAGHCVHTGGNSGFWLDHRWVFVPGYRYGQRPFGVFPARWIDTTLQWRRSGSENFDVGAAVVERNQRGQLLGKAVGGTGIAWGLKTRQVFDVHGYPAAPPFDGETQQECSDTRFLGHDSLSFLSPGPLNMAVDCAVTGGSSGGGWTIRDGVLNSVTNYGYSDDPATDFGAYFGREVARLYRRAVQVTP
jgi:V8-like Glu-specific endopeptidase